MVECCPNSQLHNVPSVGKATKMSGVDAKHSDRFSNASLLSILSRSYSKTTPVTSNSSTTSTLNPNANVGNSNVNTSKVSPTPRSSQFFGKESDKSPTLLSRFSITSGLSGQNSTKGLTQRISKGPGSNIYVSHYFPSLYRILTLKFNVRSQRHDLLPMSGHKNSATES